MGNVPHASGHRVSHALVRVAAAALARSLYHLLDRHRVDEAVDFLDDDFRGHGMGSDRAGFRAEAARVARRVPRPAHLDPNGS